MSGLPAGRETKECPFCAETIKAAAVVCRFCGCDLLPHDASRGPASTLASAWREEPSLSIQQAELPELLAALVQKSLVLFEEDPRGSGRYGLLGTIRQYGLERLAASGEREILGERHARFFLARAEAAAPALSGAERAVWLDRLEQEHDNLRAALSASLPAHPEIAIQMAAALSWFWYHRTHFHEGRGWLERALEGAPEPTPVRAAALHGAGLMAWVQGDYARARRWFEECIAIQRQQGEALPLARALRELGIVLSCQGDLEQARAVGEESVRLLRALASPWDFALALVNLGFAQLAQGEAKAAGGQFEESLTLFRELRDDWGISAALLNRGLTCCRSGNLAAARGDFEEALVRGRAAGDTWGVASSLSLLGEIAQRGGDPDRAAALYRESLTLYEQVGDRIGLAIVLRNLGALDLVHGRHARAARRLAAADAALTALGIDRFWSTLTDRAAWDQDIAVARAALGDSAFAAAWTEGRMMSLPEAIRDALDPEEDRW